MSVNVVERIVVRALDAAGITRPSSTKGKRATQNDCDRWQDGPAFKELTNYYQRTNSPKKGLPWKDIRIYKKIMPLGRLRYFTVDSGASYRLIDRNEFTGSRHQRECQCSARHRPRTDALGQTDSGGITAQWPLPPSRWLYMAQQPLNR